jgi:putative oxidoreductase
MNAFLAGLRPYAPVPLRIALAVILVHAGWHKVFHGMDGFIKSVTNMGFARWMAYFAAWSELAGGALVGVGLLTRPAALACAAVMAVAAFKVQLHAGLDGMSLALLCLAGSVSVLLSGPGRLSLDGGLFGGAGQ